MRKKMKEGTPVSRERADKLWMKLLFFVFIPISVFLAVITGIYLFVQTDKAKELQGYTYYDNYMNFSLTIPEQWSVTNPDTKSVKDTVFKATDGVLFDMIYHTLPKEVVPLSLVTSRTTDNKKAKLRSTKFFTMAFRGSSEGHPYLADLTNVMDDLKAMLNALQYSDIKIIDTVDLTKTGDKDLSGILVKASANVGDGVIVNYLQYLEPAGSNIMVATYGSTKSHKKGLEDIKEILSTLRYYEGGQSWTPSDVQAYKEEPKPEAQSTLTSNDPNRTIEAVEGGHYHEDGTWHATDDPEELENEGSTDTTNGWKVIESDDDSIKYSGGHFHEDGSWHPESTHVDGEEEFKQ